MMRMTPFIALRHLRMRLRSTILTALGVALGVTVMCTMASLLLGLQTQFIENIVENTPNITVEDTRVDLQNRPVAIPQRPGEVVALSRRPPPQANRGIANYPAIARQIAQLPGIEATAPSLSGQVVMRYGTRGQAARLSGIIPQEQARAVTWSARLRSMRGDLETRTNGAILGVELAKNLGIPVGAHTTLVAGPERQQRVQIIGLYSSGIRAIDESVIFVNLGLAQTLLDRPGQVSQIAVRIDDVNAAPRLAAQVEVITGLQSRSWQEVNEVFFGVFRLQNSMTGIMIAFIVIISGFGIASGLVTLILEKQRDIGILKALGATANRIVAIFLLEGILMGIVGALIGMGLAAIAIDILAHTPLRGEGELSTSSTFTMLRVPGVYLIPALLAVSVSILASLLPVRLAARYDPVAIIRSAK